MLAATQDDNIELTGSTKPQEPRSGPFPQGARKVREWTTLDLIASYLPSPNRPKMPGLAKDGGKLTTADNKEENVMPVSTAEYNPCGWRAWLRGTTLTLGVQNVFDADPPFVAGFAENNYDESLATIKGRLCYIQLRKRF